MLLRIYKATTPSLREKITINRKELWNGKPFKKLTTRIYKTGGRNSNGRITVFHIGGGHKRLYRFIDFKRNLFNTEGIIKRIEYDPNRSSWIALVFYNTGIISYILSPNNIKIGDVIKSGQEVEIKIGNTLPIKNIPIGTLIHNIELKPGKGGQLARSAGTYARIIQKNVNSYVMIRLVSSKNILISGECMATVGIVSNIDNKNINYGKAGCSKWKNIRPTVRGVAMNPIDHPHGGGEGKSGGGRPSVSPWGKLTKGKPTRSKKKLNRFIIN